MSIYITKTKNQQGVIEIPLYKLIIEHYHTMWAQNFDYSLLGATKYLSESLDINFNFIFHISYFIHENEILNPDGPLFFNLLMKRG